MAATLNATAMAATILNREIHMARPSSFSRFLALRSPTGRTRKDSLRSNTRKIFWAETRSFGSTSLKLSRLRLNLQRRLQIDQQKLKFHFPELEKNPPHPVREFEMPVDRNVDCGCARRRREGERRPVRKLPHGRRQHRQTYRRCARRIFVTIRPVAEHHVLHRHQHRLRHTLAQCLESFNRGHVRRHQIHDRGGNTVPPRFLGKADLARYGDERFERLVAEIHDLRNSIVRHQAIEQRHLPGDSTDVGDSRVLGQKLRKRIVVAIEIEARHRAAVVKLIVDEQTREQRLADAWTRRCNDNDGTAERHPLTAAAVDRRADGYQPAAWRTLFSDFDPTRSISLTRSYSFQTLPSQ